MTDAVHDGVTEGAAGAMIAVATGANGARVWPEAVKARKRRACTLVEI